MNLFPTKKEQKKYLEHMKIIKGVNVWVALLLLLCTQPGQAKRGWAGCIPMFAKIKIDMHILGQENATF